MPGPVEIIAGLYVLSQLGKSAAPAQAQQQPPPAPPPAAGSSAEDAAIKAGLSVGTTLAGALISAGVGAITTGGTAAAAATTTSAGAAGAAATGGASGAAQVGEGAAVTTAEVAGEAAGVVVGEAAIVLAAVIAVGIIVATLATTEAHNLTVQLRASLGVDGLFRWVWSRIEAIEKSFLVPWIRAQPGANVQLANNYSYPLNDPRHATDEIVDVWGIPASRLAAATSLFRWMAVEQTRTWASGVRSAVKWDLEHSDNWGSKVLSDADLEALGWGLSDAHVQEAIDQYYADYNPTTFGLRLTTGSGIGLAAPKQTVFGLIPASPKRTWADDNAIFSELLIRPPQRILLPGELPGQVLEQPVPLGPYMRFIGRLQALQFMLDTYQPFAGVQEPFTAWNEDLGREYNDRSDYARNVVIPKYGWGSVMVPFGPFLIDVAARQAIDPSLIANTGQVVSYPLLPGRTLMVDAAHPSEPL